MSTNIALVSEARQWLDQLDEDLRQELGDYMGAGWDFLYRMESEIRKYRGEMLDAIKTALGYWLESDDDGKFLCGLWLIERLDATEHIPELEEIRRQVLLGTSHLPASYLQWVDLALQKLQGPNTVK